MDHVESISNGMNLEVNLPQKAVRTQSLNLRKMDVCPVRTLFIVVTVFVAASSSRVFGEPLQPIASVELSGDLKAAEDVSGIAKLGGLLVVGSDEGVGADENRNIIQFLEPEGDNKYEIRRDILLFKGDKENGKEMDIEGIAVDDHVVYVIGSHSAKRNRIKPKKKYKTNLKAFRHSKISPEENRGWLYRLEVDADGKPDKKNRISLRDIIQNDDVLKTFGEIPSKENGVDIEGIAAKGDFLYLGFRGPVFRENWVPVMKLEFEDPEDYELLYVNLGGRGIRDITSVSDGFLLIAGPVGDGPASYQLYHWDGKEMIPGKDRDLEDVGKLTLLREIVPPVSTKPPARAKAEGIVVLAEDGPEYDLILVYDSAANGGAQRFRVPKP